MANLVILTNEMVEHVLNELKWTISMLLLAHVTHGGRVILLKQFLNIESIKHVRKHSSTVKSHLAL